MASLKEKYKNEITSTLKEELGYKNPMEIPKIEKVVINIGLGDGITNTKLREAGIKDLEIITAQKPQVTLAKKSISTFKLREKMPVGAKVTLRNERMYNFLAKLNGLAIPRIRDFRGLSNKGFDGRGNYNIGLKDQLIFPEIEYDKVQRVRGMNITIVTTAKTDMEARVLLKHIGFPFQHQKNEKPSTETA